MNIELKHIFLKEDYHWAYPKPRGGYTFEKIVKYIKGVGSPTAKCDLLTHISARAYKELKKFSSPQEIMDNIYWHGTGGYISGGLKAGFNFVKDEMGGGGGYGALYHSISLSRNRNKASDFTGMSRSGNVYPVLLMKGAKVKEMPEAQDAEDLEDKLVELWQEKVDAVKIGDWNHRSDEEELVVLNPKAILLFTKPESYPVFQKKIVPTPDISTYKAIYNTIQKSDKPTPGGDPIPVEYDS